MDVARYGPWAENREYIRQTTGQFYSRRFVMTYPNEQLPAGRPLKTRACLFRDDGGRVPMGPVSWDLEVPLYFGGKGFEETPSLKRSNAHEVVGAECRAVRERRGPSRYLRLLPLRGVGAERGGVARRPHSPRRCRSRAARGWPWRWAMTGGSRAT
jgi:hypothetical protein